MRERTKARASGSGLAKRGPDRAKREAEILDAAFAEFAARGYAATRLEDVARRAGVAKGLPHFYFDRKEDLFKAVLRRVIVATWIDLAEICHLGGTDPRFAERDIGDNVRTACCQ